MSLGKYSREYYLKNRAKILAQVKAWKAKNPARYWHNQLMAKRGISYEQYKELEAKQSGVCAICKQPETEKQYGKTMPLSVDHCHKSGKIRGLLCSKHNRGLGQFNDNILFLESAIAYLTKHNT